MPQRTINTAPRGNVCVQDVNVNLLKANDFVADLIRRRAAEQGTYVVNLCSSPGSGKTTLLEKTAARLKDTLSMAVLVGDLETERDAERLRKHGIPAFQIVTGGICHLEAQMVLQALDSLDADDSFDLAGVDLLVIENVGNLVCPASYDLGEDLRATLIATTEGDDKPKKYPRMFLTSDLMVVTKTDLLPYLPFSVEAVAKDAREVNHDLDVLEVASISDEGVDAWCDYLLTRIEAKRAALAEAV
ncbi:MAG: hydrogenase nickel incorporation protein HypB [Bacteroidota bacterium]